MLFIIYFWGSFAVLVIAKLLPSLKQARNQDFAKEGGLKKKLKHFCFGNVSHLSGTHSKSV